MIHPPIIHKIIATPWHHNAPLSLGVVLDDEQIFWGDVVDVADLSETRLQARLVQIRDRLQGKTVHDYRALSNLVEDVREEVEVELNTKPAASGEVREKELRISRRRFLSAGLLSDVTEKTPRATEIRMQPLPAAIRFALNQALLAAVAAVSRRHVGRVLADEFSLSPSRQTPGIQLDHGPWDSSLPTYQIPNAVSLFYRLAGKDPTNAMGDNCQLLQRFLSELRARLERQWTQPHRPVIHLDLEGGLSDLYGDNLGRILGALYGLEQAVEPFPLCLSQPLRETDKARLPDLVEMVRFRKMTVTFTSPPVSDLEACQATLKRDELPWIRLSPVAFGSPASLIQAHQICHEQKRSVSIGLHIAHSADIISLLTEMALLFATDVLSVPVANGGWQVEHVQRSLIRSTST